MSKSNSRENTVVYRIPNNFIEGGRVFNGMFKLRNVLEAIVVGGIFVLLGLAVPISNLRFRISFVVGVSLPWFFLCLVGINGDSFISFVRMAIKWKKNDNVMLFDEEIHSFEASPLDMMMSVETPRDRIISKFESITTQRREALERQRENAEFQFKEDSERSRLKTPIQRAEESLSRDSKMHQKELQKQSEVFDLDDNDIEVKDISLNEPTFSLNTKGQQFNNADTIASEDLY